MAFKLLDDNKEPIQKDGRDCLGSDYIGVVKAVNPEKRLLEIIASDETRDREGDVISQKGWDLKNYKKNPVFLWAHNYASVPLATAIKIHRKSDPSSLVLTHRFPSEGLNPFADMILNLYNEKIINAGSVGFIPYDWKEIEKDESTPKHQMSGRMFKKSELLEHSGCAVPSNPAALQLAIKATNMNEKNKELIYKAVTSNEYVILDEKKAQSAKEELEELREKGIEEIDDIGKVFQVPEKIEVDLEVEEETEVDKNVDLKEDGNKEEDVIAETKTLEEMVKEKKDAQLVELVESKIIEDIENEFNIIFDKFIKEFIGDNFEEEIKEFKGKFYTLIKAGAVLNASNKRRLREAYENIRSVLSDAGVAMEEDEGNDSVDDQVETPNDQESTRSEPSIYDIALQSSDNVGRKVDKEEKVYAESLSSISKSIKKLTLLIQGK